MLELCWCMEGMPGVSVRETGELERSEWLGDAFRDARRYPWEPRGGVPASDCAEVRPFASAVPPDYQGYQLAPYRRKGQEEKFLAGNDIPCVLDPGRRF